MHINDETTSVVNDVHHAYYVGGYATVRIGNRVYELCHRKKVYGATRADWSESCDPTRPDRLMI